ncbi:MAG: hypothetical protein WA952_04070 [Lewinella sp.]
MHKLLRFPCVLPFSPPGRGSAPEILDQFIPLSDRYIRNHPARNETVATDSHRDR